MPLIFFPHTKSGAWAYAEKHLKMRINNNGIPDIDPVYKVPVKSLMPVSAEK